ncbi:MAG: GNAT family N-acetyltransferase [Oscillospiraceae bacterium]|nr:GNAT family N-acetyltransferase [Oscillospiraceae bacterium]
MKIRNAKEKDIPGILALLQQVGKVHSDLRPDIFPAGALKYDENALAQLLQDESRPVFIADVDGKVAGYCFCVHKVIENTALSVGRQEIYIDDLCVDEHHRRMGIAKALYDHTLAYAKEIGCDMITLHVWNGNDGAIRFYEQMGMKPRYIMMEVPVEE